MCRVVLECAIVNRRLGHSIGKLAKICSSGPFLVQSAENDGSAYFMREISNSFAAVVQGLKAAHFGKPALRVLFALLDPEGDYFLYRRVWEKTGGLPFLHLILGTTQLMGRTCCQRYFLLKYLRRDVDQGGLS